jgi:hypothetical protein
VSAGRRRGQQNQQCSALVAARELGAAAARGLCVWTRGRLLGPAPARPLPARALDKERLANMAGLAINPVQVFRTLRGFDWEFLRIFTGFKLCSYALNRNRNILDVLGPVPEVGVMAKRPQGLLNVGTLSARMAVLRSCALDI